MLIDLINWLLCAMFGHRWSKPIPFDVHHVVVCERCGEERFTLSKK